MVQFKFNPFLGEIRCVVRAFPKGISPKVNVIAQLEFEFAYYDVCHYATGTPPKGFFFQVFYIHCKGFVVLSGFSVSVFIFSLILFIELP